ncbi:MAG: riboflavin biosynthesis protein RibD [Bacteroidetes bacterium CG2_30_33_31]|nr:MAG: riboflavin biosynthesis protein RibD [Bacteroidetes bacterium CG2_30_33_31]
MSEDNKYMQRCLELAKKGIQNVAPNPMVGCVIVHKGRIIGEGFHKKFGEAHAEVNAINSVKNTELLKESTLFVNLEPCSHHGKTPPCSDLIIENKIPKVVIGCQDIFEKVAGKGVEKLQNAGIDVKIGILDEESLNLNRRFFTFHQHKRPYIILKWAETIDGYIDIDRNDKETGISWITHPYLRIPVHKWRSEESGIIVGTKTALNDNPQLNTRLWKGQNPIRFLIDKQLKLPRSLYLFDGEIPTYIFTSESGIDKPNLTFIKIDFTKNIIPQMLEKMYDLGTLSLIVEGGRTIIQSFIEDDIWDEARVFVGNKTFGKGSKAPIIKKKMDSYHQFGEDRILYFRNRKQ